ncbi:MAG: hypothetical protein N3A62_03515 [Thermodesulfovibrionales bacterium]|nr:hypothetical protein [Thermodesulfovibrionales bacterium]
MHTVRLIRFIILISTFIFVYPANSQNWKDFIPQDKSSGQIVQFDIDSKKKVSESVVRVWLKIENKEQKDTKKSATPIAKTFYLTEINCTESMHRIISTSSYTQDGRMLSSTHEPDSSWYFIIPESIASYLKKAICENK